MTLDTNILIAYLEGDKDLVQSLSTWRERGGFFYISTIVEAELLSFPGLSDMEIDDLNNFLRENFVCVPFDRSLAQIAAKLRRTGKIKLPDAAIAATALFTKTPLMTRNSKDFRKIKDLQIVTI